MLGLGYEPLGLFPLGRYTPTEWRDITLVLASVTGNRTSVGVQGSGLQAVAFARPRQPVVRLNPTTVLLPGGRDLKLEASL